MNDLPQGRHTVTLERVAYALTLKSAARLGGAFKRNNQPGQQIVIALRLPVGSAFEEYVAAANILVREADGLANFTVASPRLGIKGGVDVQRIKSYLKLKLLLLIVWPSGYAMSREIALAADRVVDVTPVRPFHLVAAAKKFAGQNVDSADAKKLMEYPLSDVFAAFRTGRPASSVLARLTEVKATARPAVDGPRLEDLAGYGEAKTWGLSLAEDIEAWRKGTLVWADVDRGLLLSGAPGTGKTTFASALARSCGAHLVATSVARWQAAGHLDDTLKAMRRCFEEATAHKPAVLFIDEFDGISDRTRLVGNEHETYWRQVINFLLELMDGHDRLDGVVVIGATNHPEVIDAGLLRPGRLDRHIRIPLPDAEERKHLSRFYFGDDVSDEDIASIAAATAGLAGAHFAKAGREAKRIARRAGRAVAIEDVLAVLPKPKKIVGSERRAIAVHEAGHAVVGLRLGVGYLRAVAVPWEAHISYPLGFAHFEFDEEPVWDRQGYLDLIAMTLAGRAAEEVITNTAFDGAGAAEGCDLHKASDLATRLELQFGMGEGLAYFNLNDIKQRDLVRQNNPVVAARVERLLRREMERSREIITRFRAAVERIANVLVDTALIEGDEVRRIIRESSR